ncbi:MAG: hypothetical protein AB7S69_12040 [Salinivirgaceae bacterium]
MSKAKRKHKKEQISLKEQQAQAHKVFRLRLFAILGLFDARKEFDQLPAAQREILFKLQTKPMVIEPEAGTLLPPGFLKDAKAFVYHVLKNVSLEFSPDGPELNLYDCLYAGHSLRLFLMHQIKQENQELDALIAKLSLFKKVMIDDLELDKKMMAWAKYFSTAFSDPSLGYLVFKYNCAKVDGNRLSLYSAYQIKVFPPRSLKVQINGDTRTVFQLALPDEYGELRYVKVSLKKLGIKSAKPGTKASVYIQKHALGRLHERLDCIYHEWITLFTVESMLRGETLRNKHGHQMVAFYVFDSKVGYLLFTYVKGKIIIRTFLLITCADTPEGQKLEELMGLEKQDVQFLGVDKLSAFACSDLVSNETLRELFKRVGCEGLFNISESAKIQKDGVQNAARIFEYLNGNENFQMPEIPVSADD